MPDLGEDRFHTGRALDGDDERDRFVGYVHLNVLLLAVVEEAELVGLQAVNNVAALVSDEDRCDDVGDGGLDDGRFDVHRQATLWGLGEYGHCQKCLRCQRQ